MLNAGENEQPSANLAGDGVIDGDRGGGDALEDETHENWVFSEYWAKNKTGCIAKIEASLPMKIHL